MTPEQIKALRHSLGLSAEEFARALGVADGRLIRRWESGEIIPGGTGRRLLEAVEAIPALTAWVLEKAKKPARREPGRASGRTGMHQTE